MPQNKSTYKDPPKISIARKVSIAEKSADITYKALSHIEKCEAMRIANDPYYQHMPKDDPIAAARYAVRMGGEDHDISTCEIL